MKKGRIDNALGQHFGKFHRRGWKIAINRRAEGHETPNLNQTEACPHTLTLISSSLTTVECMTNRLTPYPVLNSRCASPSLELAFFTLHMYKITKIENIYTSKNSIPRHRLEQNVPHRQMTPKTTSGPKGYKQFNTAMPPTHFFLALRVRGPN